MLVHALNLILQRHNGTTIVALRSKRIVELPIGTNPLIFSIVEAWCIQRPTGELAGDYANCLRAFATAWRMKP